MSISHRLPFTVWRSEKIQVKMKICLAKDINLFAVDAHKIVLLQGQSEGDHRDWAATSLAHKSKAVSPCLAEQQASSYK